MKLLLRLFQWLLVGLTGFCALISLSNGQLVPFLCFAVGLIIILPPIERILTAKLAFLKNGIVKSLAWFILFNAGIMGIGAASVSIADLALCTQPQQGVCQPDTTALVKNTKKLYLSATPDKIKDSTEFNWELKYTPEPQQESTFDSKAAKAKIKDNQLLLEVEPKDLPVGTYQLSVSSNEKGFVTKTKEFTVWDSEKEAKARLGNTLKSSEISVGELRLCDRTGLPNPAESQSNSSSSDLPGLQLDDPNFCMANANTFKSNSKALGFRISINSPSEPEPEEMKVKVTWKYLGAKENPVVAESVKTLSPKTRGLMYTLSAPDGLPLGDYELIIALETKNAKPIYRQFKVQQA